MSPEAQTEAKFRVGDILVEQINDYLDRSTSPVSGGPYKPQKKDGSASQLFMEGDMRAEITFIETDDGVEVGIFDGAPDKEIKKAYNHNVGDTLPTRRFIPLEDETFKRDIMSKVKKAVSEVRQDFAEFDVKEQDQSEDSPSNQVEMVQSKSERKKTIGDILRALGGIEFENF